MPDIDAKKIEELLPCPFCGGAAQAEHFESKLGRWCWSIGCNDHTSEADDGGEPAAECYGFQPMTSFATKAEAIAAWNRRASLTAESTGNGPHEVRFAPGWLARDVAAAAARIQPKGGDAHVHGLVSDQATSPGCYAGASGGEDADCDPRELDQDTRA